MEKSKKQFSHQFHQQMQLLAEHLDRIHGEGPLSLAATIFTPISLANAIAVLVP